MEIVSLAPSNTEILYAIGAQDEIVATTSLCNYPENTCEKPGIGGWTNPKIERLEEFEPDLVIASDDLQDGAVDKVEKEGFDVLQVRPHTLQDVFESIETIGEAVGHKEKAEKLVENMRNQLEEIKFEGSPRIYCEEWMNPPMASGNWIPGLIEKAGGESFIEEGERSREFEEEALKDFDPEYIFLNVCGAGENIEKSEVMNRAQWQDISAVKNGNIYIVDDSLLNRPGPRLVDGIKKMIEKVEE